MDKKRFENLIKGSIRRRFGRFNPKHPEYSATIDALDDWQDMYSNPEGRRNAFDGPVSQTAGERARTFNKLAGATHMRRNSQTGEREFLLHRGISPDERRNTVKNGHVTHDDVSSWTPHHEVAKEFAATYSGKGIEMNSPGEFANRIPEHIKQHVLSAWIPESKIAGSPHQFNVHEKYQREHEVLVHPHTSQLVAPPAKSKLQIKLGKSLEDRARGRIGLPSGRLAKAFKSLDLNTSRYRAGQPFEPDVTLNRDQHRDPTWGSYNADLYHGLRPGQDLNPNPEQDRTTRFMTFAGRGDANPTAVLKAPLDWQELRIHPGQVRKTHWSHYLDPNFRTTHRDATFHMLADRVFGLGHYIPKTGIFRHPATGEPWSAQQYVAGSQIGNPQDELHGIERSGDLHRLAIMDTILGNNDRHRENMRLDQTGHLKLIDNSAAFDYSHKHQRQVPAYADHLIRSAAPSSVHAWLQRLNPRDLAEEMSKTKAPKLLTEKAVQRLGSLQRWSRHIQANPQASQDFGHGLELARTNRFTPGENPNVLDVARKDLYGRINRGTPAQKTTATPEEKTEQVPDVKKPNLR